MPKDNECFFCKEIEDHTQNILNKNRIIFETTNFVVLPTEGCFKRGYLLIMPKKHYQCFGEFDETIISELENIIKKLKEYIRKTFNMGCIIFEHGTRDINKLTSTSVMHAHIHVIPFEKDLINFLPDYCRLRKINGICDLIEEKDNYLFLQNIDDNSYIVKNAENYPSQFFRRIACKALGIPKYWDWKRHKYKKNMKITIDLFKNL